MTLISEYNYNFLLEKYHARELDILNDPQRANEKFLELAKSLKMDSLNARIFQLNQIIFSQLNIKTLSEAISAITPTWPKEYLINCAKDIISNFNQEIVHKLSKKLNHPESLEIYKRNWDCVILPYSSFHALNFKTKLLPMNGFDLNLLSATHLDITVNHMLPFLTPESALNLFETHLYLLPLWDKGGARAYINLVDEGRLPLKISLLMLSLRFCGDEVSRLKIENDLEFTDRDLEKVCKYAQNLTSLSIKSCIKITDAGFKWVETLSQLVHLDMSFCVRLTSRAAKSIATLKNLTSLNIDGCSFLTKEDLDTIVKTLNLHRLSLSYCNVKLAEKVWKFSQLSFLDISRTHIHDKGFRTILEKVSNLTALNVGFCSFLTDEGMKSLKLLKNLSWLTLNWCKGITDNSMEPIAELAKLTFLDLSNCCKITNKGLLFLAKLPKLSCIKLLSCKEITKEALKIFPEDVVQL